MFKYLDTEGVDFRKNLFVSKFTPEEKGTFNTRETRSPQHTEFKAYYKVEKEFVLVCIEEKS